MIIIKGPQTHHTSSPADIPLCKVGESKQRHVLSYCAAPQQLWIIHSYAKCAQISELEPIITVRRPHRQRMSSAAKRRQAVQSFELLFSPTGPLWHPQLRKTCSNRAFPRPRAHMHAHGASEQAATHTCPTRKKDFSLVNVHSNQNWSIGDLPPSSIQVVSIAVFSYSG